MNEVLNSIKKTISSEFWKQGGNQTQLSKKAGVDRKSIYRWLYADANISLKSLIKVCDALGLELVIRKKGR